MTAREKAAAHDDPQDPLLGRIVHYHATAEDDVEELVKFPLTAGQETFAAIVARVHRGGRVDLMVIDPSKGPMPRWKVARADEPMPGHWTERVRG